MAIANDVQHLRLQSDGTTALVAAEESGQEDGMNLSVRRRESVATSGYLSADEEGKLQSRIIKALRGVSESKSTPKITQGTVVLIRLIHNGFPLKTFLSFTNIRQMAYTFESSE